MKIFRIRPDSDPDPQPCFPVIMVYISAQVNTTLREVNIELGEQDWEERRTINKRKKLILEGKDPDLIDKETQRRRKKERKREKKARLLAAAALLAGKTADSPAAEKSATKFKKKKDVK